MVKEPQIIQEELLLAVKLITEVAERRIFNEIIIECNVIKEELNSMFSIKSDSSFSKEKNKIIMKLNNCVDKLRLITNIEIREILFPLEEIKNEAHLIGSIFSDNYFKWLKNNSGISSEKALQLLNDDNYKLDTANELLNKNINKEMRE